jgi:two-component system, NarL family, sensor histidine kinase UhpB
VSLRFKAMLLVGLTFVGLAAAVAAILWVAVFRGLAALEQTAVRRDVGRAVRAVDAEGLALEAAAAEWAGWEGANRVLRGEDQELPRSGLGGGSLRALSVRLLAVVAGDGRLVLGLAHHADGSTGPLSADLAATVATACRVGLAASQGRGTHGLMVAEGEPLVVAVRPVLPADGAGPSPGALLMARSLDGATLNRLGTTLDLGLAVRRLGDWAAGSDFAAVAATLDRDGGAVAMPAGGRTIVGYALMPGLEGRPVLVVRVTQPRTLGPLARRTALLLLVPLLVAVIATGLAMELLLSRVFVTRVSALDERMRDIGRNGDPSARVAVEGSDEVARLARGINTTLAALERTEAGLRESEQRYRAIVEEQIELICRWRPDGTVVFVNQAFCSFRGEPAEQILGSRFLPEGDEGRVIARRVAALTPAQPTCTFVRTYLEPDNSRRWVQWTNRAIFNPAGAAVEHQAVGRDISVQRGSEEALKSCERAARGFLGGQAETAFLTDLSGTVLASNDATATRLEMTAAKVVGSRVHDHLGREAAAQWRARVERMVQTRAPARWEEERDGRTLAIVIVPVKDFAGMVRQIATFSRDITLERRAETAEPRPQAAARRTDALERISQELVRAEQPGPAILPRVVELAAEHLPDLCLLHLLSDDGRMLLPVTFAHRDPETTVHLHRSIKLVPHSFVGGLGEEVLGVAEPLLLPETSTVAVVGNLFPELEGYLGRFPVVGLLLTPVLLRGRPVGLMTTIREVTSPRLTEADASFAVEIATRAGIAVSQVKVFDELQHELQERARVEEALRDSQSVLLQISQSLREVLWIRDTSSGRVTYVSPGYEAIWGRTCESLYQDPRSFLDGVEEEDRVRVAAETFGELSAVTRVHEYRVVRPDGSVRWVVARRFQVSAEGGGDRIIGLVEDITERKEMEQQSRRLEAQLRLLARRLEAAREEERRSLALWIHDEIGQMLTAVRMDLAWVDRKLPGRHTELKARLVELERLLEENISAVQRVSAELRPTMLEDLGLKAAIEWQVEQFGRRSGITTELDVRLEESSLGKDTSLVLFRILQEALTNIARHAQASWARVELGPSPDGLSLKVADNGRGILEDEAAGPGALGILGMRERIAARGGKLEIGAGSSGGTTLVATIPFVRVGQDDDSSIYR